MSVQVLTFFNNKGGVGKTTLVYHLAWMFSELGLRVLAVDVAPQANLTAAFLEEEQVAELWDDGNTEISTIFRSIKPLLNVGDLKSVDYRQISSNLALVPGDLGLSGFEDALSSSWTEARGDRNQERPFRILTAFWRSAQDAAARFGADLILFDVGPNLGAINRAALVGSNHVVVPLGADLFSLQGLRNLGPTLREWRAGWQKRKADWSEPGFELPAGDMGPLGYITLRHGVHLSRPVKAYTRWLAKVPLEFRRSVLDEDPSASKLPLIEKDKHCLAMLKNYNSLMPLGQEARKPIFALRAADGAIGSHARAVADAYEDFAALAKKIAKRSGVSLPG